MHPKQLLDACAELVKRAMTFEHAADSVVSYFFRENRYLGPRERATLAETTYTVLRKKLLFEGLAHSGSGPRERRLAILGFSAVLREQGKKQGNVKNKDGLDSETFIKAALTPQELKWLDACDNIKPDELMESHRHNLPEWMVEPLKAQVGDEFWALTESMEKAAPLDLRVNALNDKPAEVRKELEKAGIKAKPTPFSPLGLRIDGKPALAKVDAFNRGAIEVQDEGSQLLALMLDAKRGEMVVDFCAGAGGKTLAIGASMRNTGRLYAFDVSGHRLDALKPRLARSGLSNVHPAAIAHERDERVKRLAGKIDRVLVDAPCSGLGTLRRNPDLKWRQSPKAVEELTVKQAAILESSARLVKAGGRLIYATCSILPQENEAIAEAFSAAHPEFELLNAADVLEQIKVVDGDKLCSGGEDGKRYLRLWPHRHHTDGFFAAVWVKKA
ncbi:RsmB/NOP family class I SAM-dependent RNA methyltransferase [Comamonas sp. Y33R10-2]|uniref:RsmB/NOP family class I SAM-dependent RNA methyltransferase n=1 Tax=Comamonas sp. Y33R10-2 TaxID=2853257 RepID=UPI001C5C93E2|nr:RsmB/NOP family class I SAM-dependent RNA methyltransferase [Comamonas sp. Y33R10-2]QXZ10014.1 RsmB/NOP family class I SAM-dependent RNA methyltransferase [Comamonas sp. Y33R10-2]